jgi:Flp pilus assembly protein TadG
MNKIHEQVKRPRPRLDRNRHGAATVEFALTAPLLFMILFATLEFGRYNMIQQTTLNAAFEAARACIVPGATAANGQTAGLNILQAAGISGGTITINPSTILTTTGTVTATATVPVKSNLWVTPVFIKTTTTSKSCTLTMDWVNSTQ